MSAASGGAPAAATPPAPAPAPPSSTKSPKPPSSVLSSSSKAASSPAGSAAPIPPPPSSAKVAKPPVSAKAVSPPPPPSSAKLGGGAAALAGKAKEEDEKAKRKAEALKKEAAIRAEVPKIEVEEDEDVEPTKVGKVSASRREIQPPVEKIIVDEGAEIAPASGAAALKDKIAIYSLAQTDPGKRRKQNEDSHLVIDKEHLFVVADGMGGHKGGQIASKLAVDTIKKAYDDKRFEAAAHKDLPADASNLARALQMANSSILEEAKRRPELKGMGTTICGMRFSSNCQRLYVAHVGDSRCYRIRDGMMKQLTSDHTMADYGVAGPEGAHLSRALGVWPTVPIDVLMVTPKLGDLYLLCSDGLTKMLPDGTIATQLLHEDDPKAAVSRLVFFANAHGGKDNITIILLRIVEPGYKPPSANVRGSKPEIA
jgi:PPM family protein phosphatase